MKDFNVQKVIEDLVNPDLSYKDLEKKYESLLNRILGDVKDDKDLQKERSAFFEGMYEYLLLRLRSKFPNIPKDLTNKKINIRYQFENGLYHNIFLYDDRILLDGEELSMYNSGESHISNSKKFNKKELKRDSSSIIKKLKIVIDDIIENADKCEIKIEDLDRPRIPTNE